MKHLYTHTYNMYGYMCVFVWCDVCINTKLTKYYIKCLYAKLDAFLFRNCILTNLVSFFDRRAECFCLVLKQFFIYVCNKACIEQKVFIVFCTIKYQCKPTHGIDFRERLKKYVSIIQLLIFRCFSDKAFYIRPLIISKNILECRYYNNDKHVKIRWYKER